MALLQPIYQLVKNVRYAVQRSDALFGIVYELNPDSTGYRWRPIPGTYRQESTIRSLVKQVADIALIARAAGENRSVQIEVPDSGPNGDPARWFVSVLTQKLNDIAYVAVFYDLADEQKANERLHWLESEVTRWDQERLLLAGDAGKELVWDKLLQTCVTNTANAILVAGSPPLLRTDHGLRAVTARWSDAEDLANLVQDLSTRARSGAAISSLQSFDTLFGETHRLRISALGQPRPKAIIVSRLEQSAVAISEVDDGWVLTPSLRWMSLVKEAIRDQVCDLVFFEELPPLLMAHDGIRRISAPILKGDDIKQIVNRMTQSCRPLYHPEGYAEFGLSLNGQPYAAAFFYESAPLLILLTRMSGTKLPDNKQDNFDLPV